ncbi:MAG: hypothetical protein Crog4KO_09860 [Crocinitomicaceae bacterium]
MKEKIKYTRNLDLLEYLEIASWILIVGLPFVTSQTYFLIAPYGFAFFASLRRYKRNKTDLKNARNYFRVVHPVWRDVLTNGMTISLIVFFHYVDFGWEWQMEVPIYYLLALVVLALIIVFRFQNFVLGFRWYISGIKLPGRRSLLIPWRHVSNVRREESELYITVLGKEKKYKIHKADRRPAEAFVRHYERITIPQASD